MKDPNNQATKQFINVYKEYYHRVVENAALFVDSTMIAKDIAQDVFVKLWLKPEKLQEIKNIENYLFIITRNCALDYLNKIKNQPGVHRQFINLYRPGQNSTEDKVAEAQYGQWLHEAVGKLPARTRQAFILSRGLGLKGKHVADVMETELTTAKNQIQSATIAVQKYFGSRLPELFN